MSQMIKVTLFPEYLNLQCQIVIRNLPRNSDAFIFSKVAGL